MQNGLFGGTERQLCAENFDVLQVTEDVVGLTVGPHLYHAGVGLGREKFDLKLG